MHSIATAQVLGNLDLGAYTMLTDGYEEFNESQIAQLKRYVTNTSSNIFALRNLPEVIKGALFSRYSRSNLGLRSLLLKEFIQNDAETSFSAIVAATDDAQKTSEGQMAAIKRAQSFYDRILDGYGDDSIGELGGAHLALENISMLAAKEIEDCRIGGSPLEKSTRYVYFDQKVHGEYLFYREPILMTSAYRELYITTCNMLFETYGKLIPPLTALLESHMPKDPSAPTAAYKAALRAKVLDCLRGLLPTGTLTNMGVFGNGRFFESLLHKLHCHALAEMPEIGRSAYEELAKVIPSFVRRANPSHASHDKFAAFRETMGLELGQIAEQIVGLPVGAYDESVRLVGYDADAPAKVGGALLFELGNYSLQDLWEYCRLMPEEELGRLFDAAAGMRENRRQKSPRALELAEFTFEIVADYGIYRDLHRHRLLTQEKQQLTCNYGFFLPPEIIGTEMEKDYCTAMEQAQNAYDKIAKELPEEAQYIVPMAYKVRWFFHINLRSLQWLCELRSAPAGHPSYRYIAQRMAKAVCEQFPIFERFFKFVDYVGYDLGRLGQEQRKLEKQQNS